MYRPTALFLTAFSLPLCFLMSPSTATAVAPHQPSDTKADAGQLSLNTSRVAIFKDGYGLFVKEATGFADADGTVFTHDVPDGAILGCFWATSEDKTVGMKAEWVEEKKLRSRLTPAVSVPDLIRANQGKEVRLSLTDRAAPTVEGKLVEVLDLPAKGSAPLRSIGAYGKLENPPPTYSRPTLANAQPIVGETTRELLPQGGGLFVIDTPDQGRLVMPVREVRTISGVGIRTQIERREEIVALRKRLSFNLGKASAGQPVKLKLLYFSEGIRWIPTYRLSGDLDDSGSLALQGELLNEAEDIRDAAIDLVVGVPNFRFSGVASPLTLERTLRKALAAAAPSVMGKSNQLGNALFSQRAMEWHGNTPPPIVQANRAGGGSVLDYAPELSSSGVQDLHVYSAKHVSLNRGARLTIPLWRNDIPLRNVYTMDVPIVRNAKSGKGKRAPTSANQSPLWLSSNQVWHQFELDNTSDVPWTTGPAMMLRDIFPLGQELLTYTPSGSKVLLPVTVAVNVRGDHFEEEIDRTPKALAWRSHHYEKVSKKGTITLTNYRDKPSQMRVIASMGGLVESASDDARIRVNDHRVQDWEGHNYGPVNNHSDVTWEFELAPGETRSVTYKVNFYVR